MSFPAAATHRRLPSRRRLPCFAISWRNRRSALHLGAVQLIEQAGQRLGKRLLLQGKSRQMRKQAAIDRGSELAADRGGQSGAALNMGIYWAHGPAPV